MRNSPRVSAIRHLRTEPITLNSAQSRLTLDSADFYMGTRKHRATRVFELDIGQLLSERTVLSRRDFEPLLNGAQRVDFQLSENKGKSTVRNCDATPRRKQLNEWN